MIIQNGTISNIKGNCETIHKEWMQFRIRCKNIQSKDYAVFFINCYCFGTPAKYIAKYITSGDTVIVSGRLVPKIYKDRNGNMKDTFQIYCESIEKITQKDMIDEINIIKGEQEE